MEIIHRHALRKSDFRKVKAELSELLGEQVESLFKGTVELIKTDQGELYAENKIVLVFMHDGRLLPSLRALNSELVSLPAVTVDMGAVPYVTNGADIMAPGIRKIAEGIKKGTIVAVIDETHGKSLAVGELLFDQEEILEMTKGKAVKNLHYVSDEIWNVEL